jgi:hypothetical protein
VTPSNADLREALEQMLTPQHGARFPIVGVERRPSAYRSSFPLDEVRVAFSDGTALDMVFKDLHFHSLSDTARHAKPAFLLDPLREIETYRCLLSEHPLGTACFYGAVVDVPAERYWLFLEKVAGDELYKIGEFSTWQYAAHWLAGMHRRFAAKARLTASPSEHFLKYDRDYYRCWMRRAQSLRHSAGAPLSADARRSIEHLAGRYDRVVERLAALPETCIHGEFYASNVLIGRSDAGLRVCPVDWEMAAVGPGLVDLAALVSGRWTDEERTALALAYLEGLAESSCVAPPPELFLQALDDCRLHLAVQWLGWSAHWSPPAPHRQDWLSEALHLAEKVGCL